MKFNHLPICILANLVGIHAAAWPAAKDLYGKPITSQKDWDDMAAVAARHGDRILMVRVFGGSWAKPESPFGPQHAETVINPKALQIPYLYPFCAQLVELALQHDHLDTAEQIYNDQGCSCKEVAKTPMAVAKVLHEAAAASKFDLVPLLLRDPILQNPADPGERAALRSAADELLRLALYYEQTGLADLLVGDPRSGKYEAANLEVHPRGEPVLQRLERQLRNVLAAQKYFIEGGQNDDAPMLVSLMTGDINALKELLSHKGVHPTPGMLLMAAHHGHYDMVRYLRQTYPGVLGEMTEGVWGVLLLEAAEHNDVETIGWIMEMNTVIKAGVREALRIALEHRNVPIQRMLMGNTDFVDHKMGSTDRSLMAFFLERAIATGNAEGLELLLATDYARGLSNLKIPYKVPYDDAHKAVAHVLLQSPALDTNSFAMFFLKLALPEQQELLKLIPLDRHPDFAQLVVMDAIALRKFRVLEWIFQQFREQFDADGVKEVLRTAYTELNVEAIRLVLMYLPVDPSVKDKYCRKAMADGYDDLVPILCGVAIKGAGK